MEGVSNSLQKRWFLFTLFLSIITVKPLYSSFNTPPLSSKIYLMWFSNKRGSLTVQNTY